MSHFQQNSKGRKTHGMLFAACYCKLIYAEYSRIENWWTNSLFRKCSEKPLSLDFNVAESESAEW